MMKLKWKQGLVLTAAFAAMTAFRLTANAADTTAPVTEAGFSSVPGDVDGDFKVSIADAILFSRYLAEDPDVTILVQGLNNANLDGDDSLDAGDLIGIMRILASSNPGKYDRYFGEIIGDVTLSPEETGAVSESETRKSGTLWLGEGTYKREYEIGEALDIMHGTLYGQGFTGKDNWAFNGELTLAEWMSDYESSPVIIDASEFDSSRPGVYTIRLHLRDYREYGDGSFEVVVRGGETGTDGGEAAQSTTTETKPFCGVLYVRDGDYRTEYSIGEELDIMNAALSGIGDLPENADPNDAINFPERGVWKLRGHETLAESVAKRGLIIDTSEFDNTRAGAYRIRVRIPDLNAEGFFTVFVYDGDMTGSLTKLQTGDWYGDCGGSFGFLIFDVNAKLTYRIGEELALDTVQFYGAGSTAPTADEPDGTEWVIETSYVSDYMDYVDASEFDSTTPGVYKIWLRFPELDAEGWFEVRVIAD